MHNLVNQINWCSFFHTINSIRSICSSQCLMTWQQIRELAASCTNFGIGSKWEDHYLKSNLFYTEINILWYLLIVVHCSFCHLSTQLWCVQWLLCSLLNAGTFHNIDIPHRCGLFLSKHTTTADGVIEMQRGLKNQRSLPWELICFLTRISLNLTRKILILWRQCKSYWRHICLRLRMNSEGKLQRKVMSSSCPQIKRENEL